MSPCTHVYNSPIKVDGETINTERTVTGHGKHLVRGKSDLGAAALEAEYRRRKARLEFRDQHGKVKYIIKDGKPVEP